MTSPDFIFLNGQAARVTSLKPSDESGGFTLVVIARGGADRDQMLELLNAENLTVRIDSGPERFMRTTDIDIRSVGEGPQANHRIQAVLVPLDDSLPEPPASGETPADGRTSIEHQLDRIIELLTEIRDRM
jgi:hypothetical protein